MTGGGKRGVDSHVCIPNRNTNKQTNKNNFRLKENVKERLKSQEIASDTLPKSWKTWLLRDMLASKL